jgi:hypothetical protein
MKASTVNLKTSRVAKPIVTLHFNTPKTPEVEDGDCFEKR